MADLIDERSRVAGAGGTSSAVAIPFDRAQQNSAHRFYPMRGMAVMAMKEGEWVQATVVSGPGETAGHWVVGGGAGSESWTAELHFTEIGN